MELKLEAGVRKKQEPFLAIIVFLLGILLGAALFGSAAWADLEATFYGFDKIADRPLPGLSCPVLMTRTETAMISATFSNPTSRLIQPQIRADISTPGLPRSERTKLAIPPGERRRYSWPVTPDDIDLGSFIFAKVASYPANTLPFREASCGILIVDVPFLKGGQVFALAFASSLLLMLFGLRTWERSGLPLKGEKPNVTRAMRFLTVFVLIGMFVSFQGWWLPGMVFLLLTVLIVGVITGYFISQ